MTIHNSLFPDVAITDHTMTECVFAVVIPVLKLIFRNSNMIVRLFNRPETCG
jgi:hypothetical protein